MSLSFRPLLAVLIVWLASTQARATPPQVLATIKPVHALAAAVMEGVGTPALLIEGAASEHSYVLRPSDAEKIAAAQIVFWIGPDLETFLAGPLRNLAPGANRVALEDAAGLTRLAARPAGLWRGPDPLAGHGSINPHLWLDPANAIVLVRTMADVLAKADPADATRYGANATREIAHLERLDRRLAALLAPVRRRPFLVYHDAYPYFTQHYGLDAIGAVTVEPGRPVSPRRVVELRAAIEAGHALCLFREPQFPPALISALADGSKVRVGVLDPLGADLAPGPSLYDVLLTNLAKSLRQCLSAPA